MKRERKKVTYKSTKIKGKKEVRDWMMNYSRSFCSYIKHAERGKLNRRTIASANMNLRNLLKTVGTFKTLQKNTRKYHLDRSKRKKEKDIY